MGRKGKKKPSQDTAEAGPSKGAGGDQPGGQGAQQQEPARQQGQGDGPSQQASGGPPTPTEPQRGPEEQRGQQSKKGGRKQSGGGQQPQQQQQAQASGGGPPGQPQAGAGRGQPQGGRGQGRGGQQPQQQAGAQRQPPGAGPPQQGAGRGQGRGGPPPQQGPPPVQQQQPPPGWTQPPRQQGPPPAQQQQPPQGWAQPSRPQGPPPFQQQQQPPPGWTQPPQQQGPPPVQQQQPPPGWGQPPPQQGFPPVQQQPPPVWQQQQGMQGPPPGAPPGMGAGRGGPPPQQQQAAQQARGGPPPGQQPPMQAQQQPQRRAGPQQGPPQGRSRQSSESSTASAGASAAAAAGIARMKISGAGDANIVSKSRFQGGTMGRVIKVESNHLSLNLGKISVAYHYDVSIDPDVPKKFMRPVIEAFRRKHFSNRWPAFDGKKNMYTTSPLTKNLNEILGDEITLTEEDGREKKFKVQIKFANNVDMTPLRDLLKSPVTPQEAIQVVDIVLRMAPVATCLPVGRSFFIKPTNGIIDLGEGMEMYQGFYQSAIRGWKPLLNVDVAHKAFPQNIPVIESLAQILSTGRQVFTPADLRSLDRYQEEKLLKFIKTLRIGYEIPGQVGSRKNYRVNGLGAPAATAKFEHNGQQMTIVDYFKSTKNYHLRYPNLPTLWVGNPTRKDKILLPIELCLVLEGQAVNRKMTEQQTSKMIRHAATNTTVRKDKIMQGVHRSNYNSHPCVKEFGFSVGHEFQKLDARVLPPPELTYANNRNVRVSKGVWRNETFLEPVTINNWTICIACRYSPRPDELNKMADMFQRCGREVGMNFVSGPAQPFGTIGGRQSYRDVEAYFKAQKNKYDIIFVVVPDSGPEYSYVKKAAEISVGCLTQCVKSVTVSRKMNQQTAVNILLKVNSKRNGINHMLSRNTKPDILKRPVMIMGADVTHPGPDAKEIPSVAAVTASHDPKAFQYNICWRLQNPKVEIIEDLEAITVEHLKFFFTKTKVKPESIVFFRDGVSEGQFEQVKNEEIRAIRSACKKLQNEGFEPKITFVVVQKRHHTRLFPTNPRDSEDRNCNVPAGTCVDTDITHPFMQDFYLVSHASIQGVAKPTKYCTLWDDNNLTNDQVEQLAYYLCHMFSRCNRSVSYPAPTYYAHLAAARAKVYIENDRLNMDRLRDEFSKYEIRDEIRKGLPMFFV